MLLTKPQQQRFWRDWSAACRSQGWTAAAGWTSSQIENERYNLLRKCGFESLTQVDPLAGFDRVLAELAAAARPDDLDAQLREQQMPITRLRYAIAKFGFAPAYVAAILRDQVGHDRLDDLDETQLLNLRNTLAARACAKRRKTKPVLTALEPVVDCPF